MHYTGRYDGPRTYSDSNEKFTGNRVSDEYEIYSYTHEMVMFFINVLMNQDDGVGLSYRALGKALCERGNTKPLKRISIGDSCEDRVLNFFWQHPALFEVNNDYKVRIRSMESEIDEKLEKEIDERTTAYIMFRFEQYGPCKVPLSTLFGNLQQAAPDIKRHYGANFSEFYKFLENRKDHFVINQEQTNLSVALKRDHDKCLNANKPIPSLHDYSTDDRVINQTKIITDIAKAKSIFERVLRDKSPVALDFEGVNLGSPKGTITLVQMALIDAKGRNFKDLNNTEIASEIEIYLFDLVTSNDILHEMRELLESPEVMKILQGSFNDASALRTNFGIALHNVFDTVVAHKLLDSEGTKSELYYLYKVYIGEETSRMKKEMKKFYKNDARIWVRRPLMTKLVYYAAFDVY